MILVNLSRFVYIGEKRDASQQLCQQGLCIGGGGWEVREGMFPDNFVEVC